MLSGEAEPGARWTRRDADLACALTSYEDGLCSGCGWPADVSMDPALKDAWESTIPRRCHACTSREKAIEPYVKDGSPTRHPQHLRFPVTLTEAGVSYLNDPQEVAGGNS